MAVQNISAIEMFSTLSLGEMITLDPTVRDTLVRTHFDMVDESELVGGMYEVSLKEPILQTLVSLS